MFSRHSFTFFGLFSLNTRENTPFYSDLMILTRRVSQKNCHKIDTSPAHGGAARPGERSLPDDFCDLSARFWAQSILNMNLYLLIPFPSLKTRGLSRFPLDNGTFIRRGATFSEKFPHYDRFGSLLLVQNGAYIILMSDLHLQTIPSGREIRNIEFLSANLRGASGPRPEKRLYFAYFFLFLEAPRCY